MRDTLEPGDTVQLLAIRQENADTARNYQRLLEELTQLGIAEHQCGRSTCRRISARKH